MPSKPLEPGDPVRLGRFELLGRLGEGGQGIVYLGRGTNPAEERVAVKVLRSTVDANVLERLARELDAIHQVQPFVTAGVIEASAEGDRRYVVSEFIDGPSLQERVDDRPKETDGASGDQSKRWCPHTGQGPEPERRNRIWALSVCSCDEAWVGSPLPPTERQVDGVNW